MPEVPRLLITIGIILVVVGLLWQIGGKWIGLGRLPGDFLFKSENATVYIPIMTSIILSIVLSLIFFLIGRFR